MKKILLILNLFTSYLTFGQQDMFFPIGNEFRWVDIEKSDNGLKAKLIKDLPEEFFYYRQNDEYGPKFSDLDSCLHIIDFNNDGLDDIVFQGPNGAEPDFIYIYLNTGSSFLKIFEGLQGIFKLEIVDKRVSKIYIQDWGCCCEYTIQNYIYTVSYEFEIPKIELSNSFQYLKNTELPDSYFEKPIYFRVLNDQYNIRHSPFIDDTTSTSYCGDFVNGNSLGKIKSGSLGYALSEKTDSTGRIWWYVAMKPETKIKESMFYDAEHKTKSFKLGWISSRFIEKIDE